MTQLYLIDLPNEVLLHIASFLNGESLLSLSQTCKMLHYQVSSLEPAWQALCFREYQVPHNQGWDLTYFHLYTKILHRYSITMGFHKLALQPEGGLMHVKWCEGEMLIDRLYPLLTVTGSLVIEPAFSATWNPCSNRLDVHCLHQSWKTFPAIISKHGSLVLLQCVDPKCHRKNHKRKKCILGQSSPGCPVSFADDLEGFEKLQFIKGYSCPLLPIKYPPAPAHFPLRSGIYYGRSRSYGAHVYQVRVNSSNPYLLECLKVAGSGGIPAGQVSVRAFLDKPIVLSREDQQEISSMLTADHSRPKEAYLETLRKCPEIDWLQPFYVDRFYTDDKDIPEQCIARFIGEARVLNDNVKDPELDKAHVVVFDDATFGCFWLEHRCFILFYGVPESLRDKEDPSLPEQFS